MENVSVYIIQAENKECGTQYYAREKGVIPSFWVFEFESAYHFKTLQEAFDVLMSDEFQKKNGRARRLKQPNMILSAFGKCGGKITVQKLVFKQEYQWIVSTDEDE